MSDPKWESCMQPMYAELTRGLQVSGPLLDHLLQERLLTFEEHSIVAKVQSNTEEERVRCMLDILRKKPPGSFEKFCSVLANEQVGYKHQADRLRSKDNGSPKAEKQKPGSVLGRPVRSQPSQRRSLIISSDSESDHAQDDTGEPSKKKQKTAAKIRGVAPSSSRGRLARKQSTGEELHQPPYRETCRSNSSVGLTTRTTTCSSERLEATSASLHKPVTEKHIAVVAQAASSCWSQIGNSLLGRVLCKDTVSANTSQTKTGSEKLDDLLWKWKEKEGLGATLETLLQACDQASVRGAVEIELKKSKLL